MSEIAFIEGKGFHLRELRESDLDGNWYQWFNDSEVTRLQNKKIFPNSRDRQRAYFEQLKKSESDVVLAIVDTASGQHVGNVGLHRIDWVHRSAELGIVIGEKAFWGKGYGRQAWAMITNYGFETLNLHRIYAWVLEGNDSSAKCAEASGFNRVGTVPDAFFKNGKYLSSSIYNRIRSSK